MEAKKGGDISCKLESKKDFPKCGHYSALQQVSKEEKGTFRYIFLKHTVVVIGSQYVCLPWTSSEHFPLKSVKLESTCQAYTWEMSLVDSTKSIPCCLGKFPGVGSRGWQEVWLEEGVL